MNDPLKNGYSEFGAVLRYAWERSRGSLSPLLLWACVVLFLGARILDAVGIVTWRESVGLLTLHTCLVRLLHSSIYKLWTGGRSGQRIKSLPSRVSPKPGGCGAREALRYHENCSQH